MKKSIRSNNKRNYSLCFLLTILFGITIYSCERDENVTSPVRDRSIIFNPDLIYGSMTDIDGNVYKTVSIGTQTWMAENLKVTHYRNGDPIPEVTESINWDTLTTGAYSNFDNNPDFGAVYGKLYNWFTINDSRNIAPTGWHVSTDSDWVQLILYLGGDSIAGNSLKEEGTNHWRIPNIGANNESGFTAISCGMRLRTFHNLDIYGGWWAYMGQSVSAYDKCRYLQYNDPKVGQLNYLKQFGHAVRCVKDK